MSAQLGPYGQGQQYLPNPGSFVQNPAGTKQLTSFCFFRTVLFASGHKKKQLSGLWWCTGSVWTKGNPSEVAVDVVSGVL